MQIKKNKRKYKVSKETINDVAHIVLRPNEQITLMDINKKFQYDICKKTWGYYALPSINSRLKNFNFLTFIVKCKKSSKVFIHLVKKTKISLFKKYLKNQKLKIVNWPRETKINK